MNTEQKLNMTMLCDFYEVTMGNGYFQAGMQDQIYVFRRLFPGRAGPGGFAICAGLSQLIDYIRTSILTRRISRISAARACSLRSSWPISGISALPAISGPSPRARPSSPGSRW